MTLLRVFPDEWDATGASVTGEDSLVLAYGADRETVAEDLGLDPERIIDGDVLVQELVPGLQRAYNSAIAKIGGDQAHRLRTATNLTARGDDLPLWWLLERALRRQAMGVRHPFHRICQAEALRRVLDERSIREVLMEGVDPDALGLCATVCRDKDVPLRWRSVAETPRTLRRLGWGARGWLRLFRRGVVVGLAKLVTVFHRRYGLVGVGQSVAFFSKYPLHWSAGRASGPTMRYYRRLPALVAEDERVQPVHLIWFNGSLRASASLSSLKRELEEAGASAWFLDADVGIRDLVACGPEFARALRRYRLFRRRLLDDGVRVGSLDIGRLLVRRMDDWMVTKAPHFLVLSYELQAVLRRLRPKSVVTILFEAEEGRIVAHACRRVSPEIRVIGLQHGPITRYNAAYQAAPGELQSQGETGSGTVPLPDATVVDGLAAKEILVAAGYPADRTEVTGSVRYDHLTPHLREETLPVQPKQSTLPRVLVVLGLDDHRELLRIVLPALAHRLDLETVLRPHPSSKAIAVGIADDMLRALQGVRRPTIDGAPAHESVLASDVIVTSYSSLGVEALMMGKPVIQIRPWAQVDVSPFLDVPGVVPVVTRGSELEARIDEILEGRWAPDPAKRRELLHRFSTPLDGRAHERIAEIIRRNTIDACAE